MKEEKKVLMISLFETLLKERPLKHCLIPECEIKKSAKHAVVITNIAFDVFDAEEEK